MGYVGGDKLPPEAKRARFERTNKRSCRKAAVEQEREEQVEAASILIDLSESSVLPESGVELQSSDAQDSGRDHAGKES